MHHIPRESVGQVEEVHKVTEAGFWMQPWNMGKGHPVALRRRELK